MNRQEAEEQKFQIVLSTMREEDQIVLRKTPTGFAIYYESRDCNDKYSRRYVIDDSPYLSKDAIPLLDVFLSVIPKIQDEVLEERDGKKW